MQNNKLTINGQKLANDFFSRLPHPDENNIDALP